MSIEAVTYFSSLEAAADQVSEEIASVVKSDIDHDGEAVIAVPGGTTPIPVFRKLSRIPLQWDRVLITLTDERWVPKTDPRSNERLVRRVLMRGPVKAARFIGLKTPHRSPMAALEAVDRRLRAERATPQTVFLGMGADGHIASLFSQKDIAQESVVCAAMAPDRTPRISLTLNALCKARRIYLLFSGKEKIRIWEMALKRIGQLPVNYLLSAYKESLKVCIAMR